MILAYVYQDEIKIIIWRVRNDEKIGCYNCIDACGCGSG